MLMLICLPGRLVGWLISLEHSITLNEMTGVTIEVNFRSGQVYFTTYTKQVAPTSEY